MVYIISGHLQIIHVIIMYDEDFDFIVELIDEL
jgi:hypothetical protein